MIWIKAGLFAGTVVTIRYIFSLINNEGDEKIKKNERNIKFHGISESLLLLHENVH